MTLSMLLALGLAGCAASTPSAPAELLPPSARAALTDFFAALADGEYAAAAQRYGGSYDELIGLNPDLDPADRVGLLRRACEVNGFQCLPLREVLAVAAGEPDGFSVTVSFTDADGNLWVLGPCCGASETDMPPVSEFSVRVAPNDSGEFVVHDLPPYVP